MRNLTVAFAVLLIAALLVSGAHAQDEEFTEEEITTAKKREDVTYYMALHVDFKEGKARQGRNFIKEHFLPVDKEVGHETIVFEAMTGPWDQIAFFRMEDGPGELAWEISPSGAAWNKVFLERTGGMDKAGELQKEFQALVEKTKNELVMRPAGM